MIATAYVMTASGLSFLVFLHGLRNRLVLAEGDAGTMSRLVFACGILLVAMLFILAASAAAVAGGAAFQDEPVDAGVARFLPHVGFASFLIAGLLSGALLIVVTSVLTLTSRVFPVWLAWLGFLAAVILLFGVFFIPSIALLVWVLAVSIVMLMRSGQQIQSSR